MVQNMTPQNVTNTLKDDIDLVPLLQALWRGKFWIALCALIAMGFAGYYAYYMVTPTYTTSATVVFESREQQVVDIENVVGGLGGDQATINTEVEVLRSRGLAEKLVKRLKLYEDPEFNTTLRPPEKYSVRAGIAFLKEQIKGPPPPPAPLSEQAILDATIDRVRAHISIRNISRSLVFTITVTTQDAEKSALIANTFADIYILDQLEVKFAATQRATEWLTGRVGELQVDLEQSIAAVKSFNASSELISPEALEAANIQIKDLRDRRANTAGAQIDISNRVNALSAAQVNGDPALMLELANDRALNRLYTSLQTDPSIRAAFDARFQQILDRTRLDLDRSSAQITAFDRSIAELEAQVERQSKDLVTLQQLEREANANRAIYESFLARLKETSVQEGIQRADSRLLSAAVVPKGPSKPQKSMILMLGFMFGMGACVVLIVIRELSQNTFRTVENLETATGHTVLGQIPVIPVRGRANILKYLIEKPTSQAAEAVRNLRTSTLLSNVDKAPQVIMLTSSLPEEGKTTQALALTHNLSGLGKRVLLIEGDIRRRVFSQYFDIKIQKGLLSVLQGNIPLKEAVVQDKNLGADILMGEKSRTNAADVFSSDAFQKFLSHARAHYDYIIIDTPPTLIVPDARVIGQFVDAILYAVKWDQTTKQQVLEGLKSFDLVNATVSGLILSQISAKGMKRYGYNYGYGAYSGYYNN